MRKPRNTLGSGKAFVQCLLGLEPLGEAQEDRTRDLMLLGDSWGGEAVARGEQEEWSRGDGGLRRGLGLQGHRPPEGP